MLRRFGVFWISLLGGLYDGSKVGEDGENEDCKVREVGKYKLHWNRIADFQEEGTEDSRGWYRKYQVCSVGLEKRPDVFCFDHEG